MKSHDAKWDGRAISLALLVTAVTTLALFPVRPALAQVETQVQSSGHDYSFNRMGDLLYFEVREGDGDAAKRTHGITDRSEVRFTHPGSQRSVVARNGEATWFSFSFAVRHDRQPSNWVSIFQFVPTKDGADRAPKSPALAFELDGRDLKIVTRTDAERSTKANPRFTQRARLQNLPVSNLNERPVFHDVVGRVVFGWENDAELEIWVNGRKVVAERGINIGYNDPDGPYPKAGLYRAATSQTLQLVMRKPEISFGDPR